MGRAFLYRALLLSFLIGQTHLVHAGPDDAYNKTTDAKKIAWMDKGMKAVRGKLKDGASAKFRDAYFQGKRWNSYYLRRSEYQE